MVEYIRGEIGLTEAVDKLKLVTRRYAKRQLTWFRHEEGAKVVYADTPDGRLKGADELLSEVLVLVEELKKVFISKGEKT